MMVTNPAQSFPDQIPKLYEVYFQEFKSHSQFLRFNVSVLITKSKIDESTALQLRTAAQQFKITADKINELIEANKKLPSFHAELKNDLYNQEIKDVLQYVSYGFIAVIAALENELESNWSTTEAVN